MRPLRRPRRGRYFALATTQYPESRSRAAQTRVVNTAEVCVKVPESARGRDVRDKAEWRARNMHIRVPEYDSSGRIAKEIRSCLARYGLISFSS